jgi:3'-phosphoadenosine 5'-phosphosulfate sulfotransferase (PAPS reductase)/FAD synthetase
VIALSRIGDCRVIASVSGGKDSTALCLHLRELGIPYEPVFMDTGWENAETYRYLREELPGYIGEIRWLRSEVALPPDLEALARVFEVRLGHHSAMVRWILKKGMFPSGDRRFCTTELKVRPMGAYLDSLDVDVVNAVGIRAEESDARSLLPEWEDAPETGLIQAEVWRPLIRWTVDDVIAIHQRHGVTPNRGYLAGASRVGCWPCIRSRKKEIRDIDPERVALIRDLEAVVHDLAAARCAAKGETFDSLGHAAPTFFQAPIRDENQKRLCWPIDKVIAWSHTAHGGRQVELFAAKSHEMGCMRWGMCDVASGDAGGAR